MADNAEPNSGITGEKEKDELRMYEESLYYDCTFRIFGEDGLQKVSFCILFYIILLLELNIIFVIALLF